MSLDQTFCKVQRVCGNHEESNQSSVDVRFLAKDETSARRAMMQQGGKRLQRTTHAMQR